MTKKKTFPEEYEIDYAFQREDGYWTWGAKASVFVEVEHGVNEKNNHAKAKELFLQSHPKAKIHSVTYC